MNPPQGVRLLQRAPRRDGQLLFAAAGKLDYEGIASKRVDILSIGAGRAWQKIKVVQKGKFPGSASSRPVRRAALDLARRKAVIRVYMARSARDAAGPRLRRRARRSTPY
jgi:hypothetical protein